jgi:hypothetical protein
MEKIKDSKVKCVIFNHLRMVMFMSINPNETINDFKACGVATPLWAKCEGEAHTPKSGKLESSGTPKNSKRNSRGQISLHLSALGVIEKVLKFRCPKWPCMSHLDIFSPSYVQKKGRESNWQFDSRPLKVGNQRVPNVRSGSATWR